MPLPIKVTQNTWTRLNRSPFTALALQVLTGEVYVRLGDENSPAPTDVGWLYKRGQIATIASDASDIPGSGNYVWAFGLHYPAAELVLWSDPIDAIYTPTATLVSTEAIVQPVVLLSDSNVAGPDDSAGAVLPPLPTDGIYVYNANTEALEVPGSPVPRPGGYSSTATNAFFKFAETLRATNPNTIYVGVFTAVGGTGLHEGDGSGVGPWAPDGTAQRWVAGDSAARSVEPGAMYHAHATGYFKGAMDAAIAAVPELAGLPIADPIILGHPSSANDIDADLAIQMSRASAFIDGVRAGWSAPAAPWLMWGAPPEWTHAGPLGREGIAFVNAQLAQTKSHMAFLHSISGHVHSSEAIHFNNAGIDQIGIALAAMLPTARSRAEPPMEWFDKLSGNLERVYGLIGLVADYSGPVCRFSNGLAEVDINLTSDRLPDYAAMRDHLAAGSGSLFVVGMYDQSWDGTGEQPTAAKVGTGDMEIARLVGGVPRFHFQGLRPSFNDDQNENAMLSDDTVSIDGNGALLSIGRGSDAGRAVVAAAGVSFAHYNNGANTVTQLGSSGAFSLPSKLEFEPAFVLAVGGAANGYDLYSQLSFETAHYVSGVEETGLISGGGSDVATIGTLSIGGEVDTLDDEGRGSYVAAVTWTVAPTGEDLAAVLSMSQAMDRIDDRVIGS